MKYKKKSSAYLAVENQGIGLPISGKVFIIRFLVTVKCRQLSAYKMNALSYSSSGVKTDSIGNSFSQQAHLNATSSDSYVVISNDQTVQGWC